MTDAGGNVTLTASYTPWGDLLSIEGEGGFTWGYFGGIMDTATGLLYVGNGQYYDPQTGRFLTRNARPDQGNPYVPWQGNPSGALISPLVLVALVYGRKRKRSKWDTLIILLVLGATIGMSLSACGEGESKTVTKEMGKYEVTATIMPPSASEQYGSATITAAIPSSPGQGTPIPSWTCTFALNTTATPTLFPSLNGTVGVFGGSFGVGTMEDAGPSIPDQQMTAWTWAPSGYSLWYSQYPGYHDFNLIEYPDKRDFWLDPRTNSQASNKNAGKPGQARWAFLYGNPAPQVPTILVGYSAGADAAVLHAELRHNAGLPIEALVLIDPLFSSYDLEGQYIFEAEYQQKLTLLNNRILIVDARDVWSTLSSPYITVYKPQSLKHANVDDDTDLVNDVYNWVLKGKIGQ